MPAPYTLLQFKRDLSALAPAYSPEEARALGFLLLDEVAHLPSYWWYSAPELVFDVGVGLRLQEVVAKVRAGLPVQYALGHTTWGDLRLATDARALIPRPETLELVRWIEEDLRQGRLQPGPTLDLCTGSGCIALALARLYATLFPTLFPGQTPPPVLACDKSQEALALARQNARSLALPVTFLYADILSPPGLSSPMPGGLALLTANPPYVRESERALMEARVLDHEPALALFVPDADPLLFYRATAYWGTCLLRPGGRVYVEINEALGPQTAQVFENRGYEEVEVRQDLNGKDRMLSALWGATPRKK